MIEAKWFDLALSVGRAGGPRRWEDIAIAMSGKVWRGEIGRA